MTAIKDIKEAKKAKKLIIGTRVIFKNLKKKGLSHVIYASNCPNEAKNDLNNYSKIGKIKIEEFKGTSAKLGETCGKPFSVLLIGIQK